MITVKNLTFAYPSEPPVFEDFNLEIKKGELFGLLGPNGAGKTTLLSLITGLNTPQKGVVEVNHKSFERDRSAILKTISVVPQEYAFYDQFSAYENLKFFSRLYPHINDTERQIRNAIKLTGLENHQHRLAKHFSGGLKRRLNLAIGLLNQPELLILDEPTVGIDPQSRHFILQSIQALNKHGTTILYTSHYMEEIEHLCDTIAIMDHGKILASGNLDNLLDSKARISITTQQLLSRDRFNPALEDFIRKHKLTIDDNQLTGEIDSAQLVAALLQLLIQNEFDIEKIQYGRQTLESLFFHLTHTHLRET